MTYSSSVVVLSSGYGPVMRRDNLSSIETSHNSKRDAIQSLETVENVEQMESMFGNLQTKVLKELESQGQDISLQLEREQQSRIEKQVEVESYFQAFFSLEQLQNALYSLEKGIIGAAELEAIVEDFVKRVNSPEFKEGCCFDAVFKDPTINGLVYYNKQAFDAEKDGLINKINELRTCFTYLRMNLGQDFIFEKVGDSGNVTEIDAGKRFKMVGQGQIISSKTFTDGESVILIHFNEIHPSDCVMVSLVNAQQANVEAKICLCCQHLHGSNFTKQKGDFFGNLIQATQLKIKIRINIQKDEFFVNDEKEGSIFKASFPIKPHQWKLVVSHIKDEGSTELTLTEARWKV